MRFTGTRLLLAILFVSVTAAVLACAKVSPGPASVTPAATVTTTKTANVFASVPGIVDPANHGWPREGQGLNGRVVLNSKPQRITTLSLGHDEVTYALVPAERVVAVGKYTQDPIYSNVAELARKAPAIGREPEQIVAQRPDIVVASHTIKPELIAALKNAGMVVVQTELHNDPEGRIQDILFLGYLFGEEERAAQLAAEVQTRADALAAITGTKPTNAKPRVLPLTSYSDKIYTAGKGSTEGSIVESAGGLNVAAEASIQGNKTISAEGIIAMRPDIITIAQPADSGEEFRKKLLADSALAEVPAIKNKRVYLGEPRYYTTLSFWNIRGAEDLARILWPEDFKGREFPSFSFPVR